MVTKKAMSSKELKTTSIELLLTSPLTEVCELKIDKKLFKKLTKTGVTQDEYDELLEELESETEFYSLFYDSNYPRLSLEIDGELNELFEKYFDVIYQSAIVNSKVNQISSTDSIQTDVQYALLWDRYYKRSFWKLTINEVFDPAKFTIELNTETMIGGNDYIGFIPYYDGKEFDFSSDHGFDVDEIMLLDSNNDNYNIKIKDDDE